MQAMSGDIDPAAKGYLAEIKKLQNCNLEVPREAARFTCVVVDFLQHLRLHPPDHICNEDEAQAAIELQLILKDEIARALAQQCLPELRNPEYASLVTLKKS